MRITKIILCNLGPFLGETELPMDVTAPEKNIVLIGGKNGAGKTTIFSAVKAGMYGCRAFGHRTENKLYFNEIKKLINYNVQQNKEGSAKITVEIIIQDGKDDHVYRFEREWRFKAERIHEVLLVYRDNALLDENDKSDFENYLLELIPPDMFKYFFFDGENIGGFVLGESGGPEFKNAFLRLCGLDVMEIIRENFRRLSRSKGSSDSGSFESYFTAEDSLRQLKEKLLDIESRRSNHTARIADIENNLSLVDFEYIRTGGADKADWQSMQAQIAKEEAGRESTRKWLKDTANNILPFVILRERLSELTRQIERESEIEKNNAVKQIISSDSFIAAVKTPLTESSIPNDTELAELIITSLRSYCDAKLQDKQILMLSHGEKLQIESKIREVASFDVKKVLEATSDINRSLENVKEIRAKMERGSIENYETYLENKNRLLEERTEVYEQLILLEREHSALISEIEKAEQNLKTARAKYESYLKQKSVTDIAAKSLLAFEEVQVKLYNKYIAKVEQSFKESFNAIINKHGLVDGIAIDENLRVYPYRMQTFYAQELLRLTKQSSDSQLISQFGVTAYQMIKDISPDEEGSIEIPVEVNHQLSAGEKQVFIMALYQALSGLSKVSVPYIIDTPFARIDREHRENIVRSFFLKLKGQVIILSTDEEIVGKNYEDMRESISNCFLLEHTENGETHIKSDAYFEREGSYL